jgi:hypothetical protein
MKISAAVATSLAVIATASMELVSSFTTSPSYPSSTHNNFYPISHNSLQFQPLPLPLHLHRRRHLPSPPPEEFGGVNGSPIYDTYEIEDRGQFMQRVNNERKSLRIKKAADLLEVARIAGVELKRKEKDPSKLDLFDAEDLKGDDEYLDVSI